MCRYYSVIVSTLVVLLAGACQPIVPPKIATPARLADILPEPGQLVTVIGYGCTAYDGAGTGEKRYTEFAYDPQVTNGCPGDSGGPNVFGRLADNGAVWAVTSFGETGPDGLIHDVRGNVARVKEDIVEAIRIMAKSRFEVGIDRPGRDKAIVAATTPEACERSCIDRDWCHAWTLQGTRCYLKTVAPTWVPCADCTSGLRSLLEYDVDRPGKDYRSFPLPEARAELCAAQCGVESKCVAFTYYNQRCYLKSTVPALKSLPNAISGMKRTFEVGYDRKGNNYSVLRANSLSDCLGLCAKDSQCKAFSYITSNKRCWLKDAVPFRLAIRPQSQVLSERLTCRTRCS